MSMVPDVYYYFKPYRGNCNFWLNRQGSGTIAAHQNANLYSATGDPDQRLRAHIVTGGCQLQSALDPAYGLNIYRSTKNCDFYPVAGNFEDALIDLLTVDGDENLYRIKMINHDLYLTPAGNYSGANLSWQPSTGGDEQIWKLCETQDEASTETIHKGVDIAVPCSAALCETVAADDNRFIARYLSVYNWKLLTSTEAARIHAAGMSVVCFYEDSGSPSEQSYSNGYAQAENAMEKAQAAGQTANSAIYFAIDYDATESQIQDAVVPYFQGIKQCFEDNNSPYSIGVYGSGAVCQKIKQDSGLAEYSYLSKSYGWRGYDDYKNNLRYDVLQGAYVTYDGTQFDKGESSSESYGQW